MAAWQVCLCFALLCCWGCAGCATDDDCNGGGLCEKGVCKCDAGMTGDTCGEVNFGKSYRCGDGGLCMSGQLNGTSTWGGGILADNSGGYHMYAAMFSRNCPLDTWLTTSRVVHATSNTTHGPYIPHDLALTNSTPSHWDGISLHNPAPARAPDGTYLIYYMGTTATGVPTQGCNVSHAPFNCSSHPEQQPVCNQRVGLAYADTPYGPWSRFADPVVPPGAKGAWDDSFTTNPTPLIHANGSVLLLYKARNLESPSNMYTGVAVADSWKGPYRKLSSHPIDVPTNCEDAGIMYSEALGVYRVLLHCGCRYQYIWSRDGVHWNRTTPEVDWCTVNYMSGGSERLLRRERPQWLLSKGKPVLLINGVVPADSHNGDSFTMVTEILQ
eukprot:Sspe_Gene.3301::Locus_1080_Transcript_1_1_Confidence_1.000_Length_1223::g.3301::m.3301